MWTILKINSQKVNNGRAEGAISHLPSENLWLSQSAHNYHRALACASATAARCSVFFFYPYDLTFESFRTAHVLSRAAQPRQFIFLSFFPVISGVAAILTATPIWIQSIMVRIPACKLRSLNWVSAVSQVIIRLAYEVLSFLLVSGPLLLCLFHLYDNAFTPSSEATDDKDKCTRYLHKVLSLKAPTSSLHFYVLQSAIFAAFSSAN